jgi:hypothetical protein
MVSNGMARDLKEPGGEAIGAVQATQVLVEPEEDSLEDILHIRLVVYSPSDKGAQPLLKFVPDLLGRVNQFLYLMGVSIHTPSTFSGFE